MEGLIFGGAYVRREICVSKSIWLACSGKEIYHFCIVLLCIRGQIPSTSPPGGLYSEGRFNGGFFALRFWGAYIWRGLFMDNTQWYTSHPRVMVTNVTLNDRILVPWVPFLKIAPMINGPHKLSLFTLNIGVSIVLHLK